ncbi:MAG TPA: hypothetical protein PLZ52_04590 [Bacteroidales bacterium]|nr:hypothetical protein [Bacteroidales bacterium]
MRLISTILTVICTLTITSAFSQTEAEWSPVGIAVTGNNSYKGIEMHYKFIDCNGEQTCVIRIINHNENNVEVEWHNGIFTNESVWVEDTETTQKQIIGVKSEVYGICNDENLSFPLKQLIDKPENAVRFRAFSLKVVILN